MSFQAPAMLWGLGLVLVPLLVHLLSANQGRERRFPATRFVAALPSRRLRTTRLTEFLLLLLRMALLAALVLLLAGPRCHPASRLAEDTVVLISPMALAAATTTTLDTARSLAEQRGVPLRRLAPGFPRVGDEPRTSAGEGDRAWSLLAELSPSLPAGVPVLLLIADDPREIGWRRTPIDRPVDWLAVAPPLVRDEPRSVRLLAAPDRTVDRRRVEAALRFLEEKGWDWRLLEEDHEREAELVIALGDVSPGPVGLVLRDASPARDSDELPVLFQEQVLPSRLAGAVGGAPVIETRDGRPAATLAWQGERLELTWHSRFHPDFSPWVDSTALPELLRALTGVLAGPGLAQAADRATATSRKLHGPALWLALLVLCLWPLERAWSNGWFARAGL